MKTKEQQAWEILLDLCESFPGLLGVEQDISGADVVDTISQSIGPVARELRDALGLPNEV